MAEKQDGIQKVEGGQDRRPAIVEHAPVKLLTPIGEQELAPLPKVLGTITAGYKELSREGKPMPPRISKDGEIYVHCKTFKRLDSQTGEVRDVPEAAGLIERLKANGNRWLRIALASNNLHDVFHQRLARYSATRLEVVGDQHRLVEVTRDGEWLVHEAGTAKYRELAKTCKAEYSIYFVLADYVDGGVRMEMPDGLGYYRIRTTSKNSARRFLELWNLLRRYTADPQTGEPRLVGVPIDVSLAKEEVVTPEGVRREVFVWQFEMHLPDGKPITSRVLPSVMKAAISEAKRLSLPSTPPDLGEDDIIEVIDEDGDPVEDVLDKQCDAAHYTRAWHAAVAGTPYESEEGRRGWISQYTDGRFDSLSEFLKQASEDVALQMLNTIREDVKALKQKPGRDELTARLREALLNSGINTPQSVRGWLSSHFEGAAKVGDLSDDQLLAAVNIAEQECSK